MSAARRTVLFVAALATGLGAVLASATPALAATSELNVACRTDAPIVGPQENELKQSVDIEAPESVTAGQKFDIVITPGPTSVPASVNGYSVQQIKDLVLRVPIPQNTTYDSVDISGGDGDRPTVTVTDGVATVSAPGVHKGGSTFQLPTVTAHLTAGKSGTIESKLGGTSYDDPDLTFQTTAGVAGINVDGPTVCYANPSPVLATTDIR